PCSQQDQESGQRTQECRDPQAVTYDSGTPPRGLLARHYFQQGPRKQGAVGSTRESARQLQPEFRQCAAGRARLYGEAEYPEQQGGGVQAQQRCERRGASHGAAALAQGLPG